MPHRRGTAFPRCSEPALGVAFRWDDAPTEEFRQFIEAHKRPNFSGSVSISKNTGDPDGVPQAFVDHCKEVFQKLKYPVKEWRYWMGVTLPGALNHKAKKFAKGFPHSHSWDALTLVHFVQAPDQGGDLVQVHWKEHEVINRFKPEVGLSVVVDGYSLHGVTAVTGHTPRYVLIATGFNKE